MGNKGKNQGIQLEDISGNMYSTDDNLETQPHESGAELRSATAEKDSCIITTVSVLITVICTALAIYFCYGVVVEFMGDPISMETTLQEETDYNRIFPDVIICLRHNQSKKEDVTLADAIAEVEEKIEQSIELAKIESNEGSNDAALHDYYRKLLWSKSDAMEVESPALANPIFEDKEEFIIDCEIRKASLQNEFIDCSSYFENFLADDYANCRKLNLPPELRYAVSLVKGRIGGVKINLFINESHTRSPTEGARVVLSDTSFEITPEDHGGIDIKPGTSESINFGREQTIKISRNGKKDSQQFECIGRRDWSEYNYVSNGISGLEIFSNKEVQCQNACHSVFTNKKCGCVTSRYYGDSLCLPTKEQSTCLEKNSDSLMSKMRECVKSMCQPLCRTVDFQTSRSESGFPSDSLMPVFLANILNNASNVNPKIKRSVKQIVDNYGSSTDFSKFRSHFIHLHVYSDTYATTSNNEASVYTVWSLISNIGGNLGLFLGLSLVGISQMLIQFGSWLKKTKFWKRILNFVK